MKSPNLRHCQACSQNKGLSERQRRASPLQTGSSPAMGREAGGRQPQLERGKLGPREASRTKLQAGTRSLTKTSWDSGRVTSAWRITSRDQFPGETRHWRRACRLPPRRPSGWDPGGGKTQSPPGETALPKHLVA